MSCDPLKKAQTTNTRNDNLGEMTGKVRYNPKTGEYEVITDGGETMDTIVWQEPKNPIPPIVIEEEVIPEPEVFVDDGTSLNLDRYKVAVLLPFYTDQYAQIEGAYPSEKSEMAINYYGGIRMALEKLHQEEVKLDVAVIDTKGSIDEVKRIVERSELYNAHLILGPVKKKNIAPVFKFSKENKKVLVSPIYPGSGVRDDNPYFVQISPSLSSHCNAITKHALDNHPAENIVLVARNTNSEKNRLQYFQNAKASYGSSGSFTEYIVTEGMADFNMIDPLPYIKQGSKTVFILPSWSDPQFVFAFLRQVNLVRGPNEIFVYGMPQWKNFDSIDYEYFERCNVHFSSAEIVDRETSEARTFINNYFNQFGTVPTDDAFMGYDLMLYSGRMLKKHGSKFQTMLDQEEAQLISTKYDFEAVIAPGGNAEDFSKLSKMENKHVNIVKFADFRYQLAK